MNAHRTLVSVAMAGALALLAGCNELAGIGSPELVGDDAAAEGGGPSPVGDAAAEGGGPVDATADTGAVPDTGKTADATEDSPIAPEAGADADAKAPCTGLSCDGGCVASDVHNCGACGHDCTALPNVSGPVTCTASGQCSVPATSCASGWAHCSGNPDQGCETDITKPADCGGCGTVCPATMPLCSGSGNARSCTNGCSGTTPTLCSGSCVDTQTDNNNCGGCGKLCPPSATCSGGVCQCSSCIPSLPPGWSGPIAFAVGGHGTVVSSCDSTYAGAAFSANAELQPANASCSSCTVSPAGQYCKVVADLWWPDSNGVYHCGDSSTESANYDLDQFGRCAPLQAFGLTPAVTLHNPFSVAGTCSAPSQNPTIPPPNWSQDAFACNLASAGGKCAAGSTCVSPPASPFSGAACIFTQGAVSCPASYSGYSTVVYGGVVDTRGCTACTETYSDNGCAGNLLGNTAKDCSGGSQGSLRWGDNWTASSPVACYGGLDLGVSVNMSVAGAKCTAGGGTPTGSIAPDSSKAITVCCTQ
jgi:hypothetical protein